MGEKKVIIRPIEKKDNKGIYRLIQSILESYGLDKPGTAYYDPYLSELYEYYESLPNGQYWVLSYEGKIYGGAGIGPYGEYDDVGELQKYYISKDLQGQGYGRKLYYNIENFAKEQGYKRLYVETTDILDKANKIYKHYGFKHLDEPLKGTEHFTMNTWFIKDI